MIINLPSCRCQPGGSTSACASVAPTPVCITEVDCNTSETLQSKYLDYTEYSRTVLWLLVKKRHRFQVHMVSEGSFSESHLYFIILEGKNPKHPYFSPTDAKFPAKSVTSNKFFNGNS